MGILMKKGKAFNHQSEQSGAALQVVTPLISPVVYREVSSGCKREGAGTCWVLFPPFGILIYTLNLILSYFSLTL